jgi:protein tyrosine phosphatase (PTP) superfamily phosphohydrolase (DUF442 family)
MSYQPKPFVSKRKNPVRRWLARMSHEFKTARGPMQNRRQRFLAQLETLFIDHTFLSLLNPNRHRITEKMWRSSQPTPIQIGGLKRLGIRTVINLRGERDCASFYLEDEACRKHGIKLVNFPVNSRQPPKKEILQQLETLFANVEYPALMHCKAGADRAGLMSALYLLIAEKQPVEEAMKQLSPRYGHVRQSKAGVLDRFLEVYRDYNVATPTPFMAWAMGDYDRDAVIASHKIAGWAEWLYNDVLKRE